MTVHKMNVFPFLHYSFTTYIFQVITLKVKKDKKYIYVVIKIKVETEKKVHKLLRRGKFTIRTFECTSDLDDISFLFYLTYIKFFEAVSCGL